ncbi:hypothetical protein N1851_019817 [Merluccius polli]|uniref:Uncharacterized protein n=1 Tax=Merluccius polli TaxID=89951 RepID=A0AA47ML92_MERPO|nr:hypothetical protein N1851_019817 [Merluccius polli]
MDTWTSLNTLSYVTVKCHYIKNWEMRSVNRKHGGGIVIVKWLGKVDKVVSVVHDNTSNMMKANEDHEWESLCCMAHSLQLAIHDGFKACSTIDHYGCPFLP